MFVVSLIEVSMSAKACSWTKKTRNTTKEGRSSHMWGTCILSNGIVHALPTRLAKQGLILRFMLSCYFDQQD